MWDLLCLRPWKQILNGTLPQEKNSLLSSQRPFWYSWELSEWSQSIPDTILKSVFWSPTLGRRWLTSPGPRSASPRCLQTTCDHHSWCCLLTCSLSQGGWKTELWSSFFLLLYFYYYYFCNVIVNSWKTVISHVIFIMLIYKKKYFEYNIFKRKKKQANTLGSCGTQMYPWVHCRWAVSYANAMEAGPGVFPIEERLGLALGDGGSSIASRIALHVAVAPHGCPDPESSSVGAPWGNFHCWTTQCYAPVCHLCGDMLFPQSLSVPFV